MGPRTPAGKARSSRNALKHGILSRDLIEKGESAEELAPEGELERWLVDRIAGSLWRLRRMYVIEAGLYENQMLNFGHGRPKIDTRRPEIQGILARAFGNECGNGVAVNQLHMYESAVERSLYRALHELQRLQAARGARRSAPPAAMDVTLEVR